MSPNSPNADEFYADVKDRADDYQETVLTLIAFAALVCHNGKTRRPGSDFGFGRRMETSAGNLVSPEESITPDCVAQAGPAYGVAAEVKKQISSDEGQWKPHRLQLRKYDDPLLGWWTSDERISHSDAVLLVHQTRGRVFQRYLERAQKEDTASVGEHSSLVEFNRADEGQPYIFFRLAWGKICDADLARNLDDGRSVPMERVLRSFPQLRFYDARPPREQLMAMLWIDSFFSRASSGTPDPGTGVTEIEVSVSEIAEELQKAYGSRVQGISHDARSALFPKPAWIREALDGFVELGFANAREGERYLVRYKPILREDVLKTFCRLVVQENQRRRKPADGQLTLFSAPDSPGDATHSPKPGAA